METAKDIRIMGILNLTGDSYYAPSRHLDAQGRPDLDALLEHAGEMAAAGADILDLGACSTRPGATPIPEQEEWRRLEPGLRALHEAFPSLTLSIDTTRADIVRKSYGLVGPFWINDISAGEDDPAMLQTAGQLGLPYVAMHKRGTPQDMQERTDYAPDPERPELSPVTATVLRYFRDFGVRAEKAGIRDWILDPGFGFAKTLPQNYDLLREMDVLQEAGRPILVGISRKSMIYKLLGISPEEALAPTQVLHWAALERGASILRVHDVAEAVRTVRLFRSLSAGESPVSAKK